MLVVDNKVERAEIGSLSPYPTVCERSLKKEKKEGIDLETGLKASSSIIKNKGKRIA